MSQPILRRTDNGVTSGRRYGPVAPQAPVVLPGRTMKPQALKVSYEDTGRSNSATRFPPSQLPTANRVSYTDNYPNRANIRYSTPPSKAGVRTKSPGQAHWGPPTPLGRTQTSVGRSTAAAARTSQIPANIRPTPVRRQPSAGTNSPQLSFRARTPGTPAGSINSSAVQNLDEAVSSVFKDRVRALGELQHRVDELSQLQREEQRTFQQSMEEILQQAKEVREHQEDTEESYQAMLERERQDKEKAVNIMQRFRTEGGQAMTQLKKTLHDVRAKNKELIQQNRQLESQLEQGHRRGSQQGNSRPDDRDIAEQLRIMASLLEEQDKVIVELRERNASLSERVQTVVQQRDRLLDESKVGPFSDKKKALQNELLDEFNSPQQHRMSHERLCKLVRSLLTQLTAEQIERLRIEEQAASIAGVQDQLLFKMEGKVKELQARTSPMRRVLPPNLPKSPKPSNTPKPYHQMDHLDPEVHEHINQVNSVLSSSESRWNSQLPAGINNSRTEMHSSGSDPADIEIDLMPNHVKADSDNEHKNGNFRIDLEEKPKQDLMHVSRPRTPTGSKRETPRRPGSVSLEEQLQAVSVDFTKSLQEWQHAVGHSSVNEAKEDETE